MTEISPGFPNMVEGSSRDYHAEKGWTVNFTNYEILSGKFGKARDCIECGQCEGVCPQHLPIMEHLKAVSKHYDQ